MRSQACWFLTTRVLRLTPHAASTGPFSLQGGAAASQLFSAPVSLCLLSKGNFIESVRLCLIYSVSRFFLRQEFVDAYVNYVFQISVHEWYTAFSSGFLKVCGGKVLELFQPAELRAMVVGNSNYNWEELEEVSSGEQQPNSSAGDPIPSDVSCLLVVSFSNAMCTVMS